jgi:cyclic pyranopterin phosphate synthase
MGELTHFDDEGNAIMVDVSDKDITSRTAVAKGKIFVNSEVMEAILNHTVKKGDVLGVARVAGIMAVKNTSGLIPMCHPLAINKCQIDFDVCKETGSVEAICLVKTEGKTGVEMEALTGVTVTLLTVYDMCKAIDKRMKITDIFLEKKSGGKSGDFFYGKDFL